MQSCTVDVCVLISLVQLAKLSGYVFKALPDDPLSFTTLKLGHINIQVIIIYVHVYTCTFLSLPTPSLTLLNSLLVKLQSMLLYLPRHLFFSDIFFIFMYTCTYCVHAFPLHSPVCVCVCVCVIIGEGGGVTDPPWLCTDVPQWQ